MGETQYFDFCSPLTFRPAKIELIPKVRKHRYQSTRYSQLSTFGLTFQMCEKYEIYEIYEEKLNEDNKTVVNR